mmetsp:Transcript_16057/g.29106  ORF Transcript_16057/g.29106 Transcript_16057/m.29106 type:complete len:126 (+) Transcript_16057:679-1056(+)
MHLHKTLCQKTLRHQCGWRGYDNNGEMESLDASCCGKIVNASTNDRTGDGKRCANADCAVLGYNDCSVACEGKPGSFMCPEAKAFCQTCAKYHTIDSRLKCDGCYHRENDNTMPCMSDDPFYESE